MKRINHQQMLSKQVSRVLTPADPRREEEEAPSDTLLNVVNARSTVIVPASVPVEESAIDFEGEEFQPMFNLDQFEEQKVVVDTNNLTNAELINELEKRGLSTKGTKLEKTERLEEFLRKNESVTEDTPEQIKYRQAEKVKVKAAPNWMKKKTPLTAPRSSLPPGWR